MKTKSKKQNEAADISTGTHETDPPQQSVITQLEEQLAAAEVDAAPILATIRKYEREIAALKHELRDVTHAPLGGVEGGVPILVPKHDLTPEERMAKEKELAEKSTLLKGWEKELGPHVTYDSLDAMNRGHSTATIERLRGQIRGVEERAEEHRRKIAALESDEHVAQIRAQAEEKRREAEKLTEDADRLEKGRQAEIAKEVAELKRLTGES
ncbi:MAG: hypothetical protein WBZ42_04790 [Halobacteriota archaeon]